MTELEIKLLNIISDIRSLRDEEEDSKTRLSKLREDAAEEEATISDCRAGIRALESQMEDIICELTGDE